MRNYLSFLSFILFLILSLTTSAWAVSSTSSALDVGVSVNCPTSDCSRQTQPPETPPKEVIGCTDPQALNYDKNATIDSGKCNYSSVPNVSNFTATYNNFTQAVLLTWSLPPGGNISSVRIVRTINSLPTSPTSGEIIYDGLGVIARDTNVNPGQTYYYAAFVRNPNGDYSSGALAFVTIRSSTTTPEVPPLIPPVPPGTPGVPGGTNGTGGASFSTSGNPFANFPSVESQNPKIRKLSLGDFLFMQPGEVTQHFGNDSRIYIAGNKPFTIYLPYDKVPEVLKTIGVTVYDTQDKNKSFSFLLQLNQDKTAYTATVAPFLKNGLYPISVYILDYQDQTMKQLHGNMTVAGAGNLPIDLIGQVVNQAVDPLAVTGGLAAGASQAVLATTGATSFYDLYLILVRYLGALLGYLGLRRRSKPWGTVYDSVTKRPIDPAYVLVKQGEKEITTAITDIDGRFGFFLPAGSYTLAANKTHYQFPSQTLAGKTSDEIYNNLYFGGPVVTTGEEILDLNIPLDPVGFDWNEFAKTKKDFFQVYSKKELVRARLIHWVYVLGFVFTFANLAIYPSWLNLSLLLVYVAIQLFQIFWKARHKVVSVRRVSGEPIPFAAIRFFMADLDQMVKTVIADQLGRFYVLLRPGKYYYTVDEKLPDGSYKQVYKSSPLELKKGIIAEDVDVPEESVFTPPSSTVDFAKSI